VFGSVGFVAHPIGSERTGVSVSKHSVCDLSLVKARYVGRNCRVSALKMGIRDVLESESSDSSSVLPKDRVALLAQLSPEETLSALLDALRENVHTGPSADDGIDALYAFANVDVWSIGHSFFGKSMDLGQFERFKRVLITNPYQSLLGHLERENISALRVDKSHYLSRFRVLDSVGRTHSVFSFSLSESMLANGGQSWMVDSIIHEFSCPATDLSRNEDGA